MANTICLSTDMQTFFLIPNPGTRKTLSLSGNGVDVSFSGGDVAAKRATKAPTGTGTSFPTSGRQWTVFFNPADNAAALELIGILGQDTHHSSFSLANPVNIRVVENNIVVTS